MMNLVGPGIIEREAVQWPWTALKTSIHVGLEQAPLNTAVCHANHLDITAVWRPGRLIKAKRSKYGTHDLMQ